MRNAFELPRPPVGLRLVVEYAGQQGLPASHVLTGTRIEPDTLADLLSHVWAWQEVVATRTVMDHVDRLTLGLEMGAGFRLASLGLPGLALLSAPTGQAAINFVASHSALFSHRSRIRARVVDHELVLSFDHRSLPLGVGLVLAERDLACALAVSRDTSPQHGLPTRIALARPRPDDVTPYVELLGVEPSFDAPLSSLAFPSTIVNAAPPQADASTHAYAVAACAELVAARRGARTAAEEVMVRLWDNVPRVPGLEEVAVSLSTTARTLRRKLASEGMSFRGLVDDVRRRVATDLLSGGRHTVEQVADLLGYGDASAFTHAFRRWTGQSPRSYLAERAGADDQERRARDSGPET